MEATMHQAKTSLSKLVERALAGEDVVLTHGKNRKPIARIVPVDAVDQPSTPVLKERPIGLFAAEMGVGSDTDWLEPMSEEDLALWEGPLIAMESHEPHDPGSGR